MKVYYRLRYTPRTMYIPEDQIHKIRESLTIMLCLPHIREDVASQVRLEIARINRILNGIDDIREEKKSPRIG